MEPEELTHRYTAIEYREMIVLKAMAAGMDIDEAIHLDGLVCEALEIDCEEIPPEFIFMAAAS